MNDNMLKEFKEYCSHEIGIFRVKLGSSKG